LVGIGFLLKDRSKLNNVRKALKIFRKAFGEAQDTKQRLATCNYVAKTQEPLFAAFAILKLAPIRME
jgi:hypothetical protein